MLRKWPKMPENGCCSVEPLNTTFQKTTLYDKISVIKRIQTVTTQTSFTNLDSKTRYQVEVHANIGDSRGASSKEYFTVGLTAPTGLKINSGSIESDRVKLDWDMVDEASKYQVFYSKFETGEYSVKNVFDVKTEIDGLEAGSRYRSYVVSVDEDKNESSAASEVISFTTRLGEVSGFRVVGKNVGNGSVVLGWGDFVDDFGGVSEGESEKQKSEKTIEKISEKISGFRLEQKSRNSLGDTSSNLIGVGTYARNVTMVTLYGLERHGIYEVTIQALSKSLGAEFSSREVKLVIQLEAEEILKTPVKLKSSVNTEENENFGQNRNNAESDSTNSNSTNSNSTNSDSNSRSTVEVVTIDMTWVTVVIIVVALALVLLCVIVPCVVEFNQCASVQRVFSFSHPNNVKNDSIVQDVLNNHINAVGVFRDDTTPNATMSSRRTTQDHGSSSEMVKGTNKLKFGVYCDSSDGSGSTGEGGVVSEESQVGLQNVRK